MKRSTDEILEEDEEKIEGRAMTKKIKNWNPELKHTSVLARFLGRRRGQQPGEWQPALRKTYKQTQARKKKIIKRR